MSVCCIPQSGSKTTNKERVETSSENLFFLLTADALLLFTSGHILRKCAVENATFGEKKKILTEPFWQGTLKASQSPSPRHLSLLGYSAPPHPFSWPYKALFSRNVQPFRMTWQARDHIPAKHVSASRSSPRLIPSRPETWKIIMAPAPLYVDSCSGGKKKTNKNNNKNIEHRFWFQLLLEGKWHQAPRHLAPLPFCVSLRAGRTLMLFILLNFSATRLALLFHIEVVVP